MRPVKCGRYHPKTHTITLPLWLWGEHHALPHYLEWYVAHELAHAFGGGQAHGLEFQAVLFALAPAAWHWETTYKPRQYAELHALLYPADHE